MKVAIVGGSPSTQMKAPFEDPEFDIWVLGNQINDYNGKRISRIFEIHDNLSEHSPEYPKFLANLGIPMIVGDKFPIHDDHIKVFNKEKAKNILPFFSSSIAYMMAQAIMEEYDEIHLYGVDMAISDHEYFKQRPDMYAWITYAESNGITVKIPEESSLYKGYYDEGTDYNVSKGPFSENEFLKLAKHHQEECEKYKMLLQTHDGCRQAYERMADAARSVEAGINIKTLTETMRFQNGN